MKCQAGMQPLRPTQDFRVWHAETTALLLMDNPSTEQAFTEVEGARAFTMPWVLPVIAAMRACMHA